MAPRDPQSTKICSHSGASPLRGRLFFFPFGVLVLRELSAWRTRGYSTNTLFYLSAFSFVGCLCGERSAFRDRLCFFWLYRNWATTGPKRLVFCLFCSRGEPDGGSGRHYNHVPIATFLDLPRDAGGASWYPNAQGAPPAGAGSVPNLRQIKRPSDHGERSVGPRPRPKLAAISILVDGLLCPTHEVDHFAAKDVFGAMGRAGPFVNRAPVILLPHAAPFESAGPRSGPTFPDMSPPKRWN